MAYDKFFEELTGAIDGVRKLVGEVAAEFVEAEAPKSPFPEKPLRPTSGYMPKLGDVVRVRNNGGQPERGRVDHIYDFPRRVTVHLVSGDFTGATLTEVELIDPCGFTPTKSYMPTMGDQVRLLDKKAQVTTGFVTQVHHNYKSAKVVVGDLTSVTEQATVPWAKLELIKRDKTSAESHEEPLAPVAKGRLESELDDSLSEQIPQPKDANGPVVGTYGTDKAYEDLKAYYEGKLAQAQSDAQQVSQQYNDFVAKVAQELGFSNPASATTRDVMDFIRRTNRHFSVIRDVRARLNGLLGDREDLLEP